MALGIILSSPGTGGRGTLYFPFPFSHSQFPIPIPSPQSQAQSQSLDNNLNKIKESIFYYHLLSSFLAGQHK